MEFLKTILGEELFKQVSDRVAAYNGDAANKDKQIKIANLATGEYVAKNKFSDLETNFNSKNAELLEAQSLINELKKSSNGNEDMQSKVTAYEGKIQVLQEELQKNKLESAIKVALLGAKVTDVDYLTYKLKEKGELELGEDGNVKGIDDKITGLKTQYPSFFEGSAEKKIDENKLPNGDDNQTLTKADILKKPYAERQKIYEESPETYKNIMNS